MIVLGKKYKFTKLEKQRLKKMKIKTTVISYRARDSKEVLKEIKDIIENNNCKTIILNTRAKVDDEIIKYLTNLRLENNISMISIEH